MPRALSPGRWVVVVSATFAWTCGIADLDVSGKSCPCPSGYHCDPATQSCQPGPAQDAGSDATEDGDSSTPDGDATSDLETDSGGCPAVTQPSPTTLSSGRRHVCTIRSGELWCWGGNLFGQLGLGTNTPASVPTRVGTANDWKHVSALGDHTCAINTSSRLFCWGDNATGQIGVGNTDPQPAPVIVDLNRSWDLASAGQGISCAITGDLELFCWGLDDGGAAGTGQASGMQPTPYPVNSTLEIAQVGAATYNGCAVATNGSLYCWGQLDCYKNGTPANVLTPTLLGTGCWRQATGGHRHTCAIDSDGKLFCWGENGVGALGVGVIGQGEDDGVNCTDAYQQPQPVMPGVSWISVVAGYLSTCAISDTHQLYCWGFNDSFGVSSTAGPVLAPTKVNEDSDWAEVAPGMFHSCAKKQNGDVYCMGGTGDVGPANGPLTLVSF